jgi:hypothetical protein
MGTLTILGASSLNGDPALRRIFEGIRDLRREMRDERREANATAEANWRRWEADGKPRDAKFERRLLHAEAKTQRMFLELRRDIQAVGRAIVKTLNVHTRLLVGIDRKLGARRNGGLPNNGCAA